MPEFLEIGAITQGIHGLEKALMAIGVKLAIGSKLLQRLLFPNRGITIQIASNLWRKNEEAAVDKTSLALRLFAKLDHSIAIGFENAEAPRRIYRRNGCQAAMR